MIILSSTPKTTDEVSRIIKALMKWEDKDYSQLGGNAAERTWRRRISNPETMGVDDLLYLLEKLNAKMTIEG